jgi:hypothetical protein
MPSILHERSVNNTIPKTKVKHSALIDKGSDDPVNRLIAASIKQRFSVSRGGKPKKLPIHDP